MKRARTYPELITRTSLLPDTHHPECRISPEKQHHYASATNPSPGSGSYTIIYQHRCRRFFDAHQRRRRETRSVQRIHHTPTSAHAHAHDVYAMAVLKPCGRNLSYRSNHRRSEGHGWRSARLAAATGSFPTRLALLCLGTGGGVVFESGLGFVGDGMAGQIE